MKVKAFLHFYLDVFHRDQKLHLEFRGRCYLLRNGDSQFDLEHI